MTRLLLGCAALAVFAPTCRADESGVPSETRITLSVTAAPAPRPALRYLLLPEHREMNPGNPIQGYLKCFMGQQKFFFDKEIVQRREKLLAMPLAEFPAKELQDYGTPALGHADWAARLDTPDWQVLLKLKAESVAVLLPDVQQFGPLADALRVRFRAEAALGRFDDAVRTSKTLFAMARHLGRHPTLVGNLRGLAVANTAIGSLEEMLEQPGCPNLYWALTGLPIPLGSLEEGIRGERDIFFIGFLHDLDETALMSTDRLERFIAPLDGLLDGRRPVRTGWVRAWLDARNEDERRLEAARRRLVGVGIPEARLRGFPADQVLLLDEKREYEMRRDDLFKLLNLPMWQALPLAARIRPVEEPVLFVRPMLEGLSGVHGAQARVDRRIALLRHVEALRLHAAEHDGTLPATLSEISVPLPDDPFTGKPFRYEVNGGTAHLRGGPPPGEEKDPRFNIHYEVTLQK